MENMGLFIKQVIKQMVKDGELKIVANRRFGITDFELVVNYDDQDREFVVSDRVISKKDEWKREGLLGFED